MKKNFLSELNKNKNYIEILLELKQHCVAV